MLPTEVSVSLSVQAKLKESLIASMKVQCYEILLYKLMIFQDHLSPEFSMLKERENLRKKSLKKNHRKEPPITYYN
jgi:hypothetical protein